MAVRKQNFFVSFLYIIFIIITFIVTEVAPPGMTNYTRDEDEEAQEFWYDLEPITVVNL